MIQLLRSGCWPLHCFSPQSLAGWVTGGDGCRRLAELLIAWGCSTAHPRMGVNLTVAITDGAQWWDTGLLCRTQQHVQRATRPAVTQSEPKGIQTASAGFSLKCWPSSHFLRRLVGLIRENQLSQLVLNETDASRLQRLPGPQSSQPFLAPRCSSAALRVPVCPAAELPGRTPAGSSPRVAGK